MFGCLAVYVEARVLILRDKRDETADNGVWLATTEEYHESLRREFPNMRSIQVFGKEVTGWQVLPADAPDFEEAVLLACELLVARDPRIGKVPGRGGLQDQVPRRRRNLVCKQKEPKKGAKGRRGREVMGHREGNRVGEAWPTTHSEPRCTFPRRWFPGCRQMRDVFVINFALPNPGKRKRRSRSPAHPLATTAPGWIAATSFLRAQAVVAVP